MISIMIFLLFGFSCVCGVPLSPPPQTPYTATVLYLDQTQLNGVRVSVTNKLAVQAITNVLAKWELYPINMTIKGGCWICNTVTADCPDGIGNSYANVIGYGTYCTYYNWYGTCHAIGNQLCDTSGSDNTLFWIFMGMLIGLITTFLIITVIGAVIMIRGQRSPENNPLIQV